MLRLAECVSHMHCGRSLVMENLHEPSAVLDQVRELAIRHVGYGVKLSHYNNVGVSLLVALKQIEVCFAAARALGIAHAQPMAGRKLVARGGVRLACRVYHDCHDDDGSSAPGLHEDGPDPARVSARPLGMLRAGVCFAF